MNEKVFVTCTMFYQNMPAENIAKSVMNKNLIAIKEYGTLFECEYQGNNNRKNVMISYWVIG